MKKYDNTKRTKARLTITLPKDLLQRVDKLIDFEIIRNRSHAIEHLLRKQIAPTVSSAVILAGNKPDSKKYPPLTLISKQKLITIQIELLRKYGISTIYILSGSHQNELQKQIGFGKNFGVTIIYLQENEPRGTAGALKLIEKDLTEENVLVIHGDVLTDVDISEFVAFHENEHTLATIAVKPRGSEKKFGKVLLTGNKITDFIEHDSGSGISIVNTGVYLFRRGVFELIHDTKSKLETDIFPKLAKMGELSAFLFQGIWFDVSNIDDYKQAVSRWNIAHT